jgi:hypothetical protein
VCDGLAQLLLLRTHRRDRFAGSKILQYGADVLSYGSLAAIQSANGSTRCWRALSKIPPIGCALRNDCWSDEN